MAGSAIANPSLVDSRSWVALVDAGGVVQFLDGRWPAVNGGMTPGSSYYCFLARICGDNPDRLAAVSAGIEAVAAGEEDLFSLEFPCHLPDGDMRLRLIATRYRQGGVEGVRLMHMDASLAPDAGKAETDPQAFKMEALGRLTSGVVHDFANLLTTISGYSEMLLKRTGTQDSMRPELEEIRKAAARGAGMTAQILDYIRRQAAQSTVVNLNAVTLELERLVRPIIGEHISLVTTLSPDLGGVTADPAQIMRVLMNLVLNARDAMPGGGQITIRTTNLEHKADASRELPAGRYVMLTLTDTGNGMDPETLGHLFQPFFTTKQAGRGTGLGMSTVYGIVKQAGGDIQVCSEPGQGTTFTICLPRAGEAHEMAEPRSSAHAAGTETILLAEDEESVRKLIKHVLSARGYQVLDAADGSDAWRVFEQHSGPIDLLLTDVVMPRMNGRELAQKALQSKPKLKVIYMSGYTDMLGGTGAIASGMAFLRKPLMPDVLAGSIREVLDRSQ